MKTHTKICEFKNKWLNMTDTTNNNEQEQEPKTLDPRDNTEIPLWRPPEKRHGDYRKRQVVELSVSKMRKILEYVDKRQEAEDSKIGENPTVNVVANPRPDLELWDGVNIHEEDLNDERTIPFIDSLLSNYEDVNVGDRALLMEFDAFPNRLDRSTSIVSPVSPNGLAGSRMVDREQE